MTFPLNKMTLRVLSTLLCTSSLLACGGGGGGSANAESVQAGLVVAKGGTVTNTPAPIAPVKTGTGTPVAGTTPTPDPTSGAGGTIVALPTPAPVAPSSGTSSVITDVRLQNTAATAQTSVPVTFGQVFAVGDVKPTSVLVGRLDDNSLITLQMDVKARHADGSVRHAVISAIIPSIAANGTRTLTLVTGGTAPAAKAVLPAELLATGFATTVSATISGVKYSVSADQLLKAGAKATWLSGAVANEWHVSAPLTTAAGAAHPHLTARFAIRYYSSIKKARVDVTIENNWAYEPNPQNFKYNAEVIVGGKSVYTKTDLTHLTQARWRKLFWWGGDAPQINPMLNTKYLIASRALPNYDQSFAIAPSVLNSLETRSANADPMALGVATGYMPTTGAHDDIGLLPSWAASYVLSMDQGARSATLLAGDQAGSFGSHYRDKNTDRPVSLSNYPFMTILGRPGDTFNPVTKKSEAFPGCGGDCSSPYTHDTAHQPSLAYVPYLVTGDYYYLEELQFWAMWDAFSSNPGYRQDVKGLLISDQVRGQAWSLRTLAEAAYITPDADTLKADLTGLVNNNLDWYNATYSNNASANKLNVIINGYAIVYGNVGIAPWQDDFFTSAVGHAVELGFTKAVPLLAWKSKFPVARFTTPGVCWLDAVIYALNVRDTESSPIYPDLVQAYTATRGPAFMNAACGSAAFASQINAKIGDMGGISDYVMGYPSNLQPALAYSVDAGTASSRTAWGLFMSRTVKPNYSLGPQFSIVPR
jgi:hypothetical protein